MKNMTKKLLTLLSLIAVLALTAAMTVSCDDQPPAPGPVDDPLSGEMGSGVTYTLTTDGVLTIGGSGEMTDYASKDDVPYAQYAKHVSLVVIGKDVTSVDAEAFLGCTSLYNFRVDAENAVYTTESGVLFTKDMQTLVLYPVGSPRPFYEIPAGVTTVAENAMVSDDMTLLTLPASLTTLPANAVSGLSALAEVDFYGTEEAFASLNANGAIPKSILVSCRGQSASGETEYLEADPSYEFFGASEELTLSGSAKVLKDGMTLYIPAASKGYVEFTVACEQAGVYGLALKANDLGGRVDYVTLKNFSVSKFNAYTTSMRHLGETSGAANYSANDYCITADAFRGGYEKYYAYTYMKAGENRIRLAVTGSSSYYALGIYSMRLDMISADTANTVGIVSNESGVVPTYPNSTASQGNVAAGLFVRDGGKISYTVNVPKAGEYRLELLGNTTAKNKIYVKTFAGTPLLTKTMSVAPAEGSTSAVYVNLGTVTLEAERQTIILETTNWLNVVMLRLVPTDEAPIEKKPVSIGKIELTVNEGETDLFTENTLFPTGASAFENGVLNLKAGNGNFAYLLANVEKAGIYCIRYAGTSDGKDFTVTNASLVQGSIDGTGIVNANADFSFGWERANDGYSDYGVYVYLKKGENFLQFTAGSNAVLNGVKMAPVYLAPDYFMISTNVTQGSDLGALTDDTTFAASFYNKDTLSYNVSVTKAGSYELGGMFAGAAVNIAVYDKSGNRVYSASLSPAATAFATTGASDNFLGFATVGTLDLAVGEYTVAVSGTSDSNASKVSFLTLRSAQDSEDAVMSVARGTSSASNVTVAVNKTLSSKSPLTISVNVPDAGVYMMEFAGSFSGSKQIVYVSTSAFPGVYSANRDKDLGATKNGAFSVYAYCVMLDSGVNEIYCRMNSSALTIDLKSIRLTRIADKPAATTAGYLNGVNGYDLDAIYAQYGSQAAYNANKTGNTSENSTYGIKLIRGQAGIKTELVYRNITVERDGPYVLSGLLTGTAVNVKITDSRGNTVLNKEEFKISLTNTPNDGSETAHFVNNIATVDLVAGETYTITATAGTCLYATVSAFMLTMGEHDHDYAKHEVVSATCMTDGYDAMVCTMCGARDPENTTVLPATGHIANDAYTVERQPGCTSVGWEQLHCKTCDSIIAGTIRFLDKLGHSYATEYTVDKEATCNEDGQKSYHCTVCAAIDPASIVVLPADESLHVYTNCIILSQPTAENTGKAEIRCIHCDGKGESFVLDKVTTPTVAPFTVNTTNANFTVDNSNGVAGFYLAVVEGHAGGGDYFTLVNKSFNTKVISRSKEAIVDGYVVYLTKGANELSYSGKTLTGVTFTLLTATDDVISVVSGKSSGYIGLGKSGSASSGTSGTLGTLVVEKSGLYRIAEYATSTVNGTLTATFTDANAIETRVAFDIKTDKMVDVNGSTGLGYDELGYVYLQAGVYTVDLEANISGQFVINSFHLMYIPTVE